MNTKLVYLYIKDINRGFRNIDFNFTDEFIVKYDPETHVLNIEKMKKKPLTCGEKELIVLI
ncbi:hypothetical protein AAHB50_29310 [Bacillus toyonensis]